MKCIFSVGHIKLSAPLSFPNPPAVTPGSKDYAFNEGEPTTWELQKYCGEERQYSDIHRRNIRPELVYFKQSLHFAFHR